MICDVELFNMNKNESRIWNANIVYRTEVYRISICFVNVIKVIIRQEEEEAAIMYIYDEVMKRPKNV